MLQNWKDRASEWREVIGQSMLWKIHKISSNELTNKQETEGRWLQGGLHLASCELVQLFLNLWEKLWR